MKYSLALLFFINVSLATDKYNHYINNAAKAHDVSEDLIHAVIKQESGYNPKAESHAKAQGLMQLIPSTAELMGVSNAFNPQQNINGGTKYLRIMINTFDGDLCLALAGYNWGAQRVKNLMRKNGSKNCAKLRPYMPKETQAYTKKIMAQKI